MQHRHEGDEMTNEELTERVKTFNENAHPEITRMTEVEITDRLINALASAIIDDESGLLLAHFDDFADLLTARAFQRLSIALDQCPFHGGDIEICMDDDRDCATLLDQLFPNDDFGTAWKEGK